MSVLLFKLRPRAAHSIALSICCCACAGGVDPKHLPDGFGSQDTPDGAAVDLVRDSATGDGAAPADGAPSDAAPSDGAPSDRAPSDNAPPGDRSRSDAAPDGPPPTPCAPAVDSTTLALYLFDGTGTTARDETGQHPGELVGNGLSRTTSRPSCGTGLAFSPTTPPSYLRVDDSPAWDLTAGSFDLWVLFDADAKGTEGIVSRDASGTTYTGHVSLYRICTGAIVLRLQEPGTDNFLCTSPVSGGQWHHVAVNFGPGGAGLFLDGKPASHTQPITCGTSSIPCGSSTTAGISGNDNPWVVGALSWSSTEGGAEPVKFPMAGRVDAFRISKAPRDFATPL